VIFALLDFEPWIEEALDAAPRLPGLERDVARDPEEPRRDPIGIAERVHPPECAGERLLERVGGGAIAEQPLKNAADPRAVLGIKSGQERGIRGVESRPGALFHGLGRVLDDYRRRDEPGAGEEGHGGNVAR
jgi:hypothetical protein